MVAADDDDFILGSATGRGVVAMLLEDGGTDMSYLAHILREQTTYKLSSRSLQPLTSEVVMNIHSDDLLTLPVTLPANEKCDKFFFCMTSECGMDWRYYKVLCVVKSPCSSEEQVEELEMLEMTNMAGVCSGEVSSQDTV